MKVGKMESFIPEFPNDLSAKIMGLYFQILFQEIIDKINSFVHKMHDHYYYQDRSFNEMAKRLWNSHELVFVSKKEGIFSCLIAKSKMKLKQQICLLLFIYLLTYSLHFN